MHEDPAARLRPSSSALMALEALDMPSPLQESFPHLSESSTSGEIPIFLSHALADTLHKNKSEEGSCVYSPPFEEQILDSSSTINTFGGATGAIRTVTTPSNLEEAEDLRPVKSVPFHAILGSTATSSSRRDCLNHQQRQLDQVPGLQTSGICDSTPAALGESNSCSSWVTFKFEERTNREIRTSIGSVLTDVEQIGPYNRLLPLETGSTSLRYRCASASGLVGSSAAFRLGEAASRCMKPSGSQCARVSAILESCQTPSSRRKSAIAAALATLEARSNSAPSSPVRSSHKTTQVSPPASPSSPLSPHVPTHLLRLLNSAVELLVDQEGFRTVVARFQMHAIQDPQLTPPHRKEMAGMILFRPVERQKFPFHYGPIDRSPVLRRLTIEGEPARDYLCRQASLSLKSNGVYIVRGTEHSAFAAELDGRIDPQGSEAKLRWRFEYVVDDRPVGSSGRPLDGEKLLTPLSFACSPLLLHPIQGRKIGLAHVIKKALVPNLAAEKLVPPTGFLTSPSSSDRRVAPPTPIASECSSHRRAQSICPSELDQNQGSAAFGNYFLSNGPSQGFSSSRRQARHRRPSSAGEKSHPGSLHQEA